MRPGTRRTTQSARVPVVLLSATGLAALLLVRLRDPHIGGSYGLCPFHEATGLWCPLCGGLRAGNDLTLLRFGEALSSNALAVAVVLAGVGYFGYWAAQRWRGRSARTFVVGARGALVLAAVTVVFTVVRNMPLGAALAP